MGRWTRTKTEAELRFKDDVKAAFADLRRLGYAARMSFSCCNSCGSHELGTAGKTKYVFYSRQSREEVEEGEGVYLQWSGDGEEIVRSLRTRFHDVAWAGGEYDAIWIGPALPCPSAIEGNDVY